MKSQTDVLIVGGGLAGLRLAELLEVDGTSYQLVEARDRFGGRIKTELFNKSYFDLGPAWFWHGQPRIHALIEEFGLRVFDQYATGDLMYEDETGTPHRGAGYASMEGSLRLVGGLAALTDRLANSLSPQNIALGCKVKAISFSGRFPVAEIQAGSIPRTIEAKYVVLALPPRIAAEIRYTPQLTDEARQAMENVPTWMAGQAKAIAIYDKPFWRHAGLSGDAMSRTGPMVEIHDASPHGNGPYGLFGFIGVPVQARLDEAALKQAIMTQLEKLFGSEAASPRELIVKDWALDQNTSTKLDQAPVYAHPQYGYPRALHGLCDHQLLLGSTEMAGQFGGYLEGALEAAEQTAQKLSSLLSTQI